MFKVSARTVLELGSELISSDIIAFYELIKNGFDAQTKTGVEIRFDIVLRRNAFLSLSARIDAKESLPLLKDACKEALDPTGSFFDDAASTIDAVTTAKQLRGALGAIHDRNTITVSDSGTGMSLEELRSNFLVIGTASRKVAVDRAAAVGATKAPFLGEKGIGRLSAMRLGDALVVRSARTQDTNYNELAIDWAAFADLSKMLEDIDVAPTAGEKKSSQGWCGTAIVVGKLTEDWTRNRVSRMVEYDFARLTDPFVDQKDRPRVAIVWNGERMSIPWMNQALLKNAHARVSGAYAIEEGQPVLRCRMEALDLGFEHPLETEDAVIPLEDLRSLVSGQSEQVHDGALVSVGPFAFEAYWYNRRRLTGIDTIGDKRAVSELQDRWSGILLFRDRFRVFPYGDDDDDWLALDRKALRRSGYTLNKTQFIGRVTISRMGNPALIDQTNREGLRETPEQQVFLDVLQHVIQDQLFRFMRHVERQYKGQKIDLSDAKSEVETLEKRAHDALRRLRKVAPAEESEAVETLQQTLIEFSEFAERARARIEEVEQESRQMIEMAGVGLMVEVVAHELARASENALENLDALKGRAVPDEVKQRLDSLRAQMKSLSKRVRVLDPLSVSGRQRTETFSLTQLVKDSLEAHEAQFARHNIRLVLDLPESPVRVRAVKGMIVQILENLVSNSKYWLEMRQNRAKAFEPEIRIKILERPLTIVYEDNGLGVAPGNREKIFRPFFSLKEKTKRRGLGLFIAREAAVHNGGTLELVDEIDPQTKRLHRFVLELPNALLAS